ncbi:MAG: NAD(P)-dependent glycerol-3-phosphate dehydrogenase [Oscillospiraceae bacterium]|nr:NAD(P)-dependent glycerol-3-phosphate dehydrogenase [Oscillospiraceae bacterium]
MSNKSTITILGCGFGTALAVMFANAGHTVNVWTKFQDERDAIIRDKEHKKLLPGVKIPPGINITTDISSVGECDFLVFAIPSAVIREVAEKAAFIKAKTIVNVGKGFEEKTHKLQSEVIAEFFPRSPVVVLTGPCHAEEVGRGMPTTVTCASKDTAAALTVQEKLQNEWFRIYLSDDVVGCELGGALKNPIALCCGIVQGMGYGDNTLAALMTRGLAEITRLGVSMGAKWETFTGLSGIGDLIVTCTSRHSRNHRAGVMIGEKAMPAKEAVKHVGTVEGYACAKIASEIAKERGVSVPIIDRLCAICFDNALPIEALKMLMGRPHRNEKEEYWAVDGQLTNN